MMVVPNPKLDLGGSEGLLLVGTVGAADGAADVVVDGVGVVDEVGAGAPNNEPPPKLRVGLAALGAAVADPGSLNESPEAAGASGFLSSALV